MAKLRALTDAHEVEGFVVGQPNLIAGTVTDSTPLIDKVVASLKKTYPHLEIHFVDEGHTSKEASRIQLEGGMKASKRREKGSLDAIAASLILQRHLDAGRSGTASKPLPDFSF
jgi:putative Holliday junction resolvase